MATALVVLTLVIPRGLAAGGRRGATLVITRLDGTRISGELVAVKPESLVLLTDIATDASVNLFDIKSVRILRRSRARLYAPIAGAAGLVGGTLWGLNAFRGEEDQAAFSAIWGLCSGAIGALSGLLVGAAQGIDSSFTVAGQGEGILAGYWIKLAALSREGRLLESPGTPAASSKAARRPAGAGRSPRFRLGLGATADALGTRSRESEGSFRFPGEAPPELGPYPADFSQGNYITNHLFRLSTICLGYEWTAQVAVEAECFVLGRGRSLTWGALNFTSSFDGRRYGGVGTAQIDTRFSGLLVGLAFRPHAPSAFERHIVEIGAAIGPAIARGTTTFFPFEVSRTQAVRKTTFAGRIRAAYDYYPIPTFSVGAVVDWRFVQTDLSGLTFYGNADFVDVEDTALSFLRLTEVAFPPLAVKATGFYWGLRLSIRI